MSLVDLERMVSRRQVGGVVSFTRAVHDHERSVIDLEFEAHPGTGAVLKDVEQEICDCHDLVALGEVHRSGRLSIGDAALISVVSAHRAAAFATCADLVDEGEASRADLQATSS